MARFRYTGNSSLPQVILGLTFSADDWTEVAGELAERLSRHSHLEMDGAASDPDLPTPKSLDLSGGYTAFSVKRRGRPPKVREG